MLAAQDVAKEAAQGEDRSAANDNAPGQVVVSGATAAGERALVIAKTKGAKRALSCCRSARPVPLRADPAGRRA